MPYRRRSYSRRRGRRSSYTRNASVLGRSRVRKMIEKNYIDKATGAFGNDGTNDYHNIATVNATTGVFSSRRILGDNPALLYWALDTVTSVNADTLKDETCLTKIPQGTSTNTRIGRKIFVKDIMFDLRAQMQAYAAQAAAATTLPAHMSSTYVVVFVLFRHRSSQGNSPLPEDLYVTDGSHLATSVIRNKNHTSTYDVVKTFRRTIKLDWEAQTNEANAPMRGAGQTHLIKKVPINKYVMYKPGGTAGNIADHMDGGLYMAAYLEEYTTTQHQCSVSGYARLNFIDI